MTYHARITKELILEFDFEEDEIEDGDDEFIAAQELALSYPDSVWDDCYMDVDVVKL